MDTAIRRSGFSLRTVLSGRAPGPDRHGEEWATHRGIDVELYPAEWKRQGKAAGLIRNCRMAQNADALVAVWDGKSPGTQHMISVARSLGLRVFVYKVTA